jgi:hypothetical protein
MTNPNALIKAKAEGEAKYQELITTNEVAAQKLRNIAGAIQSGCAVIEKANSEAAWQLGAKIEEAYQELGTSMAFAAWWKDGKTWGDAGQPPLDYGNAVKYKRLHAFCSGELSGRRVSQPKVPEGFSARALVELTQAKHIKDERLNEYGDDGVRTKESAERLEVVEDVYRMLKDRIRKARKTAEAAGKPLPFVSARDVAETLEATFADRNMVTRHMPRSTLSLNKFLREIEYVFDVAVSRFNGDLEALREIGDAFEEGMALWEKKHGRR